MDTTNFSNIGLFDWKFWKVTSPTKSSDICSVVLEDTSKRQNFDLTRQNGATTFQSLVCCTWLAARMGSLVQRMLVTKARSWHQVVLVQLVNGSSGLARVFNSSTIVDCARFQFLHNPIVLAILRLCSPFSANCWKPVNIGRRNWNGRLRNLISSCLEIALFPMYILLFDSISNP